MYESKLSMLVPQEMIKMSLKWTTELRDELLNKLWNIRNTSMVDTLHMAIRHLNSNIEVIRFYILQKKITTIFY
jgi:hypothetical protein